MERIKKTPTELNVTYGMGETPDKFATKTSNTINVCNTLYLKIQKHLFISLFKIYNIHYTSLLFKLNFNQIVFILHFFPL